MPRLVLDTNVLLPFIIGTVDPDLLGSAKRLKEYCPDDYEIITTYIGLFQDVILLPNIVTETSNFLGQLTGERRKRSMSLLADLAASSRETYVESAVAFRQPECLELGVTDAAILCVLDRSTYLLTSDFSLYVAAISRERNAQYFEDLRA